MVVWFKVGAQLLPGSRSHRWVEAFEARFQGLGLPIRQVEKVKNGLESIWHLVEKVFALQYEYMIAAEKPRPTDELIDVDAPGEVR